MSAVARLFMGRAASIRQHQTDGRITKTRTLPRYGQNQLGCPFASLQGRVAAPELAARCVSALSAPHRPGQDRFPGSSAPLPRLHVSDGPRPAMTTRPAHDAPPTFNSAPVYKSYLDSFNLRSCRDSKRAYEPTNGMYTGIHSTTAVYCEYLPHESLHRTQIINLERYSGTAPRLFYFPPDQAFRPGGYLYILELIFSLILKVTRGLG